MQLCSMNTTILLSALKEMVEKHIAFAEQLRNTKTEVLNKKQSAESWSALECLQHLNLYGNFYIPEISKSIQYSDHLPKAEFKPGFLGNYFANAMLPKEKLNKMKTFKNMNPINSILDKNVIDVFIAQQKEMLQLLESAMNVDLNKTKTHITLTKFIKLKLGDTFRFVIYHNERHIQQALRAIA